MYILRLEQERFEGPMELLLSLIEKRKLDVTRLSLASIAEEYLAHIAAERDVPLANLSSFLGVAAQLLLIKSKSLLPFLKLEQEEEASIEDLQHRLEEYRRFKDAALVLGGLFARKRRSHPRRNVSLPERIFFPPSNVDPERLKERFSAILGEIPVADPLEERTIGETVTIEERMSVFREAFERRIEASFHELVADTGDRMEVIVSFLALLELVKQRVIRAEQEGLFVEIRMTRHDD